MERTVIPLSSLLGHVLLAPALALGDLYTVQSPVSQEQTGQHLIARLEALYNDTLILPRTPYIRPLPISPEVLVCLAVNALLTWQLP